MILAMSGMLYAIVQMKKAKREGEERQAMVLSRLAFGALFCILLPIWRGHPEKPPVDKEPAVYHYHYIWESNHNH